MIPLFDTHSHLTLCTDHISVQRHLELALQNNVRYILDPGIHPHDYPKRKNILHPYKKNVFLSIALDPHAAASSEDHQLLYLQNLLQNDSDIIALSEIGLDYHYHNASKKKQRQNLAKQVHMAIAFDKPIFLHVRGDNAFQEARDIILDAGEGKARGAIHCFTGDIEDAKIFLALGFLISFSGIVTFKSATDIQKAAKYVPLSQILAETDSPYLSPVPLRGRFNTSANIVHTVQFLSQLKQVQEDVLRYHLLKNSIQLLFQRSDVESFLA